MKSTSAILTRTSIPADTPATITISYGGATATGRYHPDGSGKIIDGPARIVDTLGAIFGRRPVRSAIIQAVRDGRAELS